VDRAIEQRRTRAIIAAMAVLGVAVSAYQLTRPGALFGVTEYDDGAYFGSAVRLVHGSLPYRDFVLVQPPGFTLLASPVALLTRFIGTRDAFAVARLLMPVVAGLNVVLLGRLIRHRGQLATLVATGLLAVFPAEIAATHTLLLEPLLNLFCLLGAMLIFRGDTIRDGGRRLLLAGLVLGFAGTIKGWAVIPVAVLVVLCLPQVRSRVVPLLGGVFIGFAAPTLPLALLAPGSFYSEVIANQLRRVGYSERVSTSTRLGDLTGASALTPSRGLSLLVAGILLAALAGLIIAALVWPRRRPTALEWFAMTTMAGVGLLLLAPSEFYDHYAAFFAPFLALTVGCAVDRLWARRGLRAGLALAAAAIGSLAFNQSRIVYGEHGNVYTTTIGAIIPAGACTLSDNPSYGLTTDRFLSTVPGCDNSIPDPYGTTLSYGGMTPEALAFWQQRVDRADYLVLYALGARDGRIPLQDGVQAQVTRDFTLRREGVLFLYVRHGFPGG
jgi:hypothetical protein